MIKILSQHLCFGGNQLICSHYSKILDCTMRFAIFLPPQAKGEKLPALFWLSGLTCTEENFIIKSGAQRVAASLGVILIVPDTSPRGDTVPDKDSINIGKGAGFYIDATQSPWVKHYKMYSYLTQEFNSLVTSEFSIDSSRQGIFGHSMGGHGALILAIKNPQLYQSLSVFSPICSVRQSEWGQEAFNDYLGNDHIAWKNYDACDLIKDFGWPGPPILIDQGTKDPFLKEQLMPELFEQACKQKNIAYHLRMQTGYDHSFYFISTFIEDHIKYHAHNLNHSNPHE